MQNLLPQRALILKPNISREQVEELAAHQQWSLAATQEASPMDEIPSEMAWVTSNRRSAIHLVDDRELLDQWQFPYYLDTLQIILEGEELASIEELLRTSLQTYTLEEIINLIEKSINPHEISKFLGYLGMVVPEAFDPRIFDILEKMIAHNAPQVRLAAVWAAGSTGWPLFQEKLESVAKMDPSGAVAEIAYALLPGFAGDLESRLLHVLD
jgi:hypothetical protein